VIGEEILWLRYSKNGYRMGFMGRRAVFISRSMLKKWKKGRLSFMRHVELKNDFLIQFTHLLH